MSSPPFQKVKGPARSGFASTPAQSPVQTPVQTPVGSVYVSESPIPSSEAPQVSGGPPGAGITDSASGGMLPKHHLYPNAGYLGSSSHSALFSHLPVGLEQEITVEHGDFGPQSFSPPNSTVNEAHIAHGAQLIDQLCRYVDIPDCLDLAKSWLQTGANLVLGGMFTQICLETIGRVLLRQGEGVTDAKEISRCLFYNSRQPLLTTSHTILEEYSAQFDHLNARWESICLALIAISRATMGYRQPTGPFPVEAQRRHIRRLTMHFADRCLDICLSMDCLNDLQLVLQYENFILHSLIDGDQSYESWRRLGDLSSSLFALGYHQQLESSGPIPPFLRSLRQAAFACSYSADKNVSIFLGRPPRISRKFCHFRQLSLDAYYSYDWAADSQLDLFADTRWAALCAILKEEIIVELFGEERFDNRVEKASRIQNTAELQWSSLPKHFRLDMPMKSCDRSAAELDLMLGIKLNYLHVLFLQHLALVRRVSEPDTQLRNIAQEILSLVVEAVLFKDHLVHSGTSLTWKVVYYGLAAAGVICLSLLQNQYSLEHELAAAPKILRDLGVLVAEIEYGTLVYKEDANYALLAGATQTIKNILDNISRSRLDQRRLNVQAPDATAQDDPELGSASWDLWGTGNLQDFDTNFWLMLAEHPLTFNT
ncbi:hypothetical protein ACKLNR_001375 [Fusarium oxysporum f. sp. zingiberi]